MRSKRMRRPSHSCTPPAYEVQMLGLEQYVFVQAVNNMMVAALEKPCNQRLCGSYP